MAAPYYRRNGNQRSRPNHRKQTAATICASGQRRFAELVLIKLIKMDSKIGFEMSLIVVEAIRGRCVSFMILTATVSETIGGQTNSSILVVWKVVLLTDRTIASLTAAIGIVAC